jgi:hypothetical protein
MVLRLGRLECQSGRPRADIPVHGKHVGPPGLHVAGVAPRTSAISLQAARRAGADG